MIVAGFGFRAQAQVESLADAYQRAKAGVAIEAISTLSDKATEPAFQDFARRLGLPIIAVDQTAVGPVDMATHSAQSMAARGLGSVAEAAALSAAGPGAILLTQRVISEDRYATCAVAHSPQKGSTS